MELPLLVIWMVELFRWMENYKQAENILTEYTKQSEEQINLLNKVVLALRTKISMLEKELKENENIPVPRTVINQILELEMKNRKMKDDLNYYLNFVPENVKEKRTNQTKPTRSGGLR